MTPTEIRQIVSQVVSASPGWTVRQSEAESCTGPFCREAHARNEALNG